LDQGDALEVPSLTGTDLASCALSQGHTRFSLRDLNWIGLELMKDCRKVGDVKAAASVYSTLVSANKVQQTSDKKKGPRDRLRAMLESTSRSIAGDSPARRATVDVDAES
jgi:hypothetical protein